jgi:hypothetical protein
VVKAFKLDQRLNGVEWIHLGGWFTIKGTNQGIRIGTCDYIKTVGKVHMTPR